MDEDGEEEEEEEVVVVEVSTSLSLLFQLLQIVPWCTHTSDHRVQEGTIEMSVAKNFNYRTGTIVVVYLSEYMIRNFTKFRTCNTRVHT